MRQTRPDMQRAGSAKYAAKSPVVSHAPSLCALYLTARHSDYCAITQLAEERAAPALSFS
jgi:hypothetical protein